MVRSCLAVVIICGAMLHVAGAPWHWAQSQRDFFLTRQCALNTPLVRVDETSLIVYNCDASEVEQLEFREDVVPHESTWAQTNEGISVTVRKRTPHRWDRLWERKNVSAIRTWARDTAADEEDADLPSGGNIKRLRFEDLTAYPALVVAPRFPWCAACEEHNEAFKDAVARSTVPTFVFGVLDLRENKEAVRRWNLTCDDACPLLVFKEDEPLEPHQIFIRLLYETDETTMMMAEKVEDVQRKVKPDIARFEADLRHLLTPAVTVISEKMSGNVVIVADYLHASPAYQQRVREASRHLRADGVRFVTCRDPWTLWCHQTKEGSSTPLSANVTLIAQAHPENPLAFAGPLESLPAFVRLHVLPLIADFDYGARRTYEAATLYIGALFVNASAANTRDHERAEKAVYRLARKRRKKRDDAHNMAFVRFNESHAYYLKEYGRYGPPYMLPYFGITTSLGFSKGMRFGFPADTQKDMNDHFHSARLDKFCTQVLAGKVKQSFASGSTTLTGSGFISGEVQEVVWNTFEREVGASARDVLFILYHRHRADKHTQDAVGRILAQALKDVSSVKVCRMEVMDNHVPAEFARDQLDKNSTFYWVAPSISSSSKLTVKKFVGKETPSRLLRFFHKQSISSWALSEALEIARDLEPEILDRARVVDAEEKEAKAGKTKLVNKMVESMKEKNNLVDLRESLGLKKAANATVASASKKKTTTKNNKGKKIKGTVTSTNATPLKKQNTKKTFKDRNVTGKTTTTEKTPERRMSDSNRSMHDPPAPKNREQTSAAHCIATSTPATVASKKSHFVWFQHSGQVVLVFESRIANVTLNALNATIRGADDDWALTLEWRECIHVEKSHWTSRTKSGGGEVVLEKRMHHRWDMLVREHGIPALRGIMKKDWKREEADVEDEVDLITGRNLKTTKNIAYFEAAASASHDMVVLIMRYPWCDLCSAKDKEFAKAAKVLEKQLPGKVMFGVVDARNDPRALCEYNATCDEQCVIHLWKAREQYSIPSPATGAEVEMEIYKHLIPLVSRLDDVEDFTRLKSAFPTLVVSFTLSNDTHTATDAFRATARELRGIALCAEAAAGLLPNDVGLEIPLSPLSQKQHIVVVKGLEDPVRAVEVPRTTDNIVPFIKVMSVPSVNEFSLENRKNWEELAVPMAYYWSRPETTGADTALVHALATITRGRFIFVHLNVSHVPQAMLLRSFGLHLDRVPAFGLATKEAADAERFALHLTRDEQASLWANAGEGGVLERVRVLCDDFERGVLAATAESADLGAYTWPGVGTPHETTWKSYAQDISEYARSSHVLLEVYAFNRPQQQSHRVAVEVLAEALKNVTGIKVACLESMNNYVPREELGIGEGTQYVLLGPNMVRPLTRKLPNLKAIPQLLVKFVERTLRKELQYEAEWANTEVRKRLKQHQLLERDWEKRQHDEWMQHEWEEFERYKREGKFTKLNG